MAADERHVYIASCYEDRVWVQRLRQALRPLETRKGFVFWDRPEPGEKTEESRKAAINRADIAILLVSADFLADTDSYASVMPHLLKRAAEGSMVLTWIPLRHTFYEFEEFAGHSPLISAETPLAGMNANACENALTYLNQTLQSVLDSGRVSEPNTAETITPQEKKPDPSPSQKKKTDARPNREIRVTVTAGEGKFTCFWTTPSGSVFSTSFEPPLSESELARLANYFSYSGTTEDIRPFLSDWGRRLFDALFTREAYSALNTLDKGGKQLTLISNAAAFLRQPWELMMDNGRPLSNDCLIRRRGEMPHTPSPLPAFGQTLRVLYVLARPELNSEDQLNPLGSLPGIFAALDHVPGFVDITFCDPATLNQVDTCCREAERAGKPFHVLHFDGHGIVQPHQASLCFEDESGGLHLVSAGQLGAALQRYKLPLMILDACHGSSVTSDHVQALAPELLTHGCHGIIAFSQSIDETVSGNFCKRLYTELGHGHTVSQAFAQAVNQVRHLEGQNNPLTHAPYLTSWFVPQLYQSTEDPAFFEGRPKDARPRKVHAFNLPHAKDFGFFGRLKDFHALRLALRENHVVVLSGEEGVGKTTLAVQAAQWLAKLNDRDIVYLDLNNGPDDAEKTHAALAKGALVIWDQAGAKALDAAVARHRAPTAGTLLVLTRETALPPMLQTQMLGPLQRDEAVGLIKAVMQRMGIKQSPSVTGEINLRHLAGLLDCYPERIITAARALRQMTVDELIEELEAKS